MLFEQIKTLIVAGSISVMLLSGSMSCSDSEKIKAEQMYANADLALADGDYMRAIAILDSLDSIYPKAIEIRRKSLHLRPRAIELSVMASAAQIDSAVASLTLVGDSLQSQLVKVEHPIEPYYVVKNRLGKSVVGSTGIEARMMPDGTIYLISSLSGHKIKHISLTATTGMESASTSSIPHDGERNDRSSGYEVIHFMPAECDQFCKFLTEHSDITLIFNGENGESYDWKLTQEEIKDISDVYFAAENLRERHRLILEKQKLEKQLDLSRRQQAATLPD